MFIATLVPGLAAGSESRTEHKALIDKGLEAYAQAQALTERSARLAAFSRSHRFFAQATAAGATSAALYTNQGTAALQAEALGDAIFAFRQALAIEPSLRPALQNLSQARAQLPAWVPRPTTDSLADTFFFWQRTLPQAQLQGLAALVFVFATLCFGLSLARPNRLVRALGFVFAGVWLVLLGSSVLKLGESDPANAVIVAEDTIARAADSINAPARFAQGLPAGTEVSLVEERGSWLRIRLANGREAWVQSHAVQSLDL